MRAGGQAAQWLLYLSSASSAKDRHYSRFNSWTVHCIARRTPLAPVRDALDDQATRVPACVRSRWGRGLPAPVQRTMNSKEPDNLRTDDSIGHGTPALDSFPAGKNHEDLLLCSPENDTQWYLSDTHVDLMEVR